MVDIPPEFERNYRFHSRFYAPYPQFHLSRFVETKFENDAVWKWMDSYCAAYPKDNLVTAAEKLFLERYRAVSK